ncbi:MAG: glycosyltransferase family 1 protein [Candidatus Magasanikbacteria bacterium]|nr:glycosyltransferase family 1 protein [Candidatus Magasanikbacteria bacterium]
MIIGIDASHANKANRTGVEEYCFQIIEELKKIIPPNVRVILFSATPLMSEFSDLPNNWEVKILRWPLKKSWSQTRLASELWLHPVDIYFSPGQLLPFFSPKNSVVTVHDSAFEAYPQVYRFWGRQYLKWMNKLIVKKSKLILTSTKFNKSELLRYYGHLFEEQKELFDKIKVVPLAYDDKKFNLDTPSGVNNFGQYILSIGRLEEKKNTKMIVEAFDLLKTKLTDLKLVLVGSPGAGYAAVKQAIEASEYKKDILELGYVSDVVTILKNAQVFAFPSLYEGFGIPVLESMAMGVPVAVSDIESIHEVGGQGPVYATGTQDLADQILRLMSDNVFRESKIDLGLQVVKGFSWEKTAKLSWDKISTELD